LWRQACLSDVRFDALLAEDLHGARIDAARFGMDRRAGMALDEQAANAASREQQRRREPDRAATDNQNRHALHDPPLVWCARPPHKAGLYGSVSQDAARS